MALYQVYKVKDGTPIAVLPDEQTASQVARDLTEGLEIELDYKPITDEEAKKYREEKERRLMRNI